MPPACTLPVLPAADARPIDLLGLGEASLDVAVTVDGFPDPDAKVPAADLALRPGGQVATAVRAVARLGWRAAYAGTLGDDGGAQTVVEALSGDGVRLDALVRRPGVSSRSAVVLVDRVAGTRTVLGYRDPRLDLTLEEIGRIDVSQARVLLLDGTDPSAARQAGTAARAAGTRVVVDLDEAAREIPDLAPLADVVMASEGLARALGGSFIAGGLGRLVQLAAPAAVVCVTLGPRGAVAVAGGQEVRVPAFEVPCVDSTGAGDVFHAGFIAAWLEPGLGGDLRAALRMASAAAALACTAPGAQGALPDRAGVHGLLSSGRVITA